MSDPRIEARSVSWSAGGRLLLDGISLRVEPGSTLGLLGPNGSGKSSLLRLLAGLRRPGGGAVLLAGRSLAELPARRLAQRLAVVEQQVVTEVDLTVLDVVRLGRTPHRRPWDGERPEDRAAIAAALEHTALGERVTQRWSTLSGGERQRVQIARALAQQPSELLLDEPTNHLDIHHQLDLLSLVVALPVTSVIALHDLNLAAMFCDRLVLLDRGRVAAAGTPAEVLTPELIQRVYRVRAAVTAEGPDGQPHVRFLPTPRSTRPAGPSGPPADERIPSR